MATFQVRGELPGATDISFSLVDTQVKSTSQVTVNIAANKTVTLKVSFQSRSNPEANIENLMVKWIRDGVVVDEELVTTNQDGEADITLPSENSGLTIWAKGERGEPLHSLTTEMSAAESTIEFGEETGKTSVNVDNKDSGGGCSVGFLPFVLFVIPLFLRRK